MRVSLNVLTPATQLTVFVPIFSIPFTVDCKELIFVFAEEIFEFAVLIFVVFELILLFAVVILEFKELTVEFVEVILSFKTFPC